MRALLAATTGVIGRRMTPRLNAGGHDVTGPVCRDTDASAPRAVGAQALTADALDADELCSARAAITTLRRDVPPADVTVVGRVLNIVLERADAKVDGGPR